LEQEDNDAKLAAEVARWLRTKIHDIEEQRARVAPTA
jgi:hypothetical protein